MKYRSTIHDTLACNLEITASARKGIVKWSKDEHAFFSMQNAFYVHIEKRPENRHGNMSFSIFFDNVTNDVLSKQLDKRVAVMECIYKDNGFLATGFRVRGRKEPVQTNRRHPVRLKFNVGRGNGIAMPIDLYTSLRELPIAEERSEYVKKRIASWEGYLRIEERIADVADLTSAYSMATLNEDFSKISLVCQGLQGKEWRTIEGFSVKMKGLQNDIGNVIKTNRSKKVVEIELNQKYKEMARRNEWHPKSYKEVVFSNFAELSQVRRLRKGFKDLQDGLAANANLEKVLFDERPVVRISKKKKDLVFHNELNKFQKAAVTGAMTANDLYVIQGPPGTGKTTVISEICYQNVKAGLRTLVASQANLAVDNALGRLLSDQDIRILRYGRTESIEEEGKKFIEENVALNWKNETLHAVNEQLHANPKREAELAEEVTNCGVQLQVLQEELTLLEEKVKLKESAQREYVTRSQEMKKIDQRLAHPEKERGTLLESEVNLKKLSNELIGEIDGIEKTIQSESISTQKIDEMKNVEQQLKEMRHYISYCEIIEMIGNTENTIAMIHKELAMKKSTRIAYDDFLKELESIKKIDRLEERINDLGVIPPVQTNQEMIALNELISAIKSNMPTDEDKKWAALNDRILTATGTIERVLTEYGYSLELVKRNMVQQQTNNQKLQSAEEINGFINRIGRFLMDPSTKRTLETRNYSAQKYDYLERLASSLGLLYERSHYVRAQGKSVEKVRKMTQDSKEMYMFIKTEITRYLNESIKEIEQEENIMQRNVENHQLELGDLQKTVLQLEGQLGTVDKNMAISVAKEELTGKEKLYTAYMEKQASLQALAEELKNKKNDAQVIDQKSEENSIALQLLDEKIELLCVEKAELENQITPLLEVIEQNPEEQREQTLTSFYALSKKIEELTIEKERLPITYALQKEWASLLTAANEYDLDEIRKLYVQHANVIGTTCVASARRDFMEEYPTFDVVIIDEVSKATPPELLLPMLKGKKIILVGDHHQLPPLMGHETLDELLEESENTEMKRELEKLLKESLFERLFRTLPDQNKMMLGIQYRMHESIMETITPFYKEGNYSLQCGLTDSDAVRDHLIESRYIQRDDHLLWFDMPNEPNYFEEKVKGGTSRFNQAELAMTKNLLMDLEAATIEAKNDGRMKKEDQKSVGVISFYGEQVKRIDRLIEQELSPAHLNCRTGSVDKFQGMEMDVIILSFVRNHQDKGGDIGFARDYRRLNVALSRARELLIIVGSSEMFTMRVKQPGTKEMYNRLLENIKIKNGFRDHEGNVKL